MQPDLGLWEELNPFGNHNIQLMHKFSIEGICTLLVVFQVEFKCISSYPSTG